MGEIPVPPCVSALGRAELPQQREGSSGPTPVQVLGSELWLCHRGLGQLSCALTAVCPLPPRLGHEAAKKWLIHFMISFNPLENIFPMCNE